MVSQGDTAYTRVPHRDINTPLKVPEDQRERQREESRAAIEKLMLPHIHKQLWMVIGCKPMHNQIWRKLCGQIWFESMQIFVSLNLYIFRGQSWFESFVVYRGGPNNTNTREGCLLEIQTFCKNFNQVIGLWLFTNKMTSTYANFFLSAWTRGQPCGFSRSYPITSHLLWNCPDSL